MLQPVLWDTGVPRPRCLVLGIALLTQVPTQHSINLAMGRCFPASPKVPTLVGTGTLKRKANRDEEREENRWQSGEKGAVSARGGRRAGAAQRRCPRHMSQDRSPFPSSG